MSVDKSLLEGRTLELESLKPVAQPHPYPYANFQYRRDNDEIDPDDYLEGTMLVRFTVNERGRVNDPEVIEAAPPNFERMEWRVRQSLKDFVYRPRFVDGELVETADHLYRHDYFYLQSEYQASLLKSRRLNRPTPDVE